MRPTFEVWEEPLWNYLKAGLEPDYVNVEPALTMIRTKLT
jgi:hypothetical protein